MSALAVAQSRRVGARLLTGATDASLGAHRALHGGLPARVNAADVEASGLTGRGGAAFPTARKLRTVARHPRTRLIANGTEGEPLSAKDAVLLMRNPHLVLDGMLLAAGLIGAHTASVAVASDSVAAGVAAAIAERPPGERPVLVRVPHSFVAGEESALLNALDGGPAAPTGRRPYEAGVLVQNVETLAHLALVARYGSDWFRDVGTDAEPGTALATVRGSVATPGVLEFEHGETLGRLLDRCGGATEPLQAVLVGGYFGTWVPYDPRLVLSNAGLRRHGATLGARVVLALPASANGLIETTRIVRYLAGESAGQCGPCVFGLPALADALEAGDDERAVRLARTVKGRGACAHPDGAAQLVESAYRTFAS